MLRGCRRGAVLQAILFHLLTATLRPTLESFERLVFSGELPEQQGALCVRHDASVHPHAPHFWSTAVSVLTLPDASTVPKCLEAVVGAVVAAGKSVALLRAHSAISTEVGCALSAASSVGGLVDRCDRFEGLRCSFEAAFDATDVSRCSALA
jgi:hypothetical protein